eukprot:scaffold60510_cov61-Phaeocystis_antarctica.AAC.2
MGSGLAEVDACMDSSSQAGVPGEGAPQPAGRKPKPAAGALSSACGACGCSMDACGGSLQVHTPAQPCVRRSLDKDVLLWLGLAEQSVSGRAAAPPHVQSWQHERLDGAVARLLTRAEREAPRALLGLLLAISPLELRQREGASHLACLARHLRAEHWLLVLVARHLRGRRVLLARGAPVLEGAAEDVVGLGM